MEVDYLGRKGIVLYVTIDEENRQMEEWRTVYHSRDGKMLPDIGDIILVSHQERGTSLPKRYTGRWRVQNILETDGLHHVLVKDPKNLTYDILVKNTRKNDLVVDLKTNQIWRVLQPKTGHCHCPSGDIWFNPDEKVVLHLYDEDKAFDVGMALIKKLFCQLDEL
jgi:hypothetical protein